MPRLRLLPPVTTVYSDEEAVQVLDYLMKRGGHIAIDSETTGLDLMRSQVLCWSMATEDRRYFIAKEHLYRFEPLFKRADITWIFANAKYDMHMFTNMGMHLKGKLWDIIVMDAMDDDTRAHGLKEQAALAYDVRWGDFKDLFLDPEHVSRTLGLERSSFAKFKKMSIGDKLLFVFAEQPQIVENYASCDAYFTYMRAMDLQTQLAATELPTDMAPGFQTLFDYYEVLEVPFTRTLFRIERVGVPIDLDYIDKIDGPMRDGIRAAQLKIKTIAGHDYNPASRDDLRDILFTKKGFGLTPISYTTSDKTPAASTAEKDIEILKGRVKDQKAFDFIDAHLTCAHLEKLHGTFVKKIKTYLGPDGRIHCRLNQAIARTGRLTSSNPNLQQIPTRRDEFKIRGAFVSPPGMTMFDADYPQIQPRLAAVFAGEEKLMEDIRKGYDIHSANAANMFGPADPRVTYESVDGAKALKETQGKGVLTELHKLLLMYRDSAKTVGLGVLFGEGPNKMKNQLRIDLDAAKGLIQRFFTTYPGIRRDIDAAHDYAHEFEVAYTLLGRLRRMHRVNNPYNRGIAAAEERAAYNHRIQGSEIEIMKCAMLQIDNDPDFNALGGQLAMTVHDELVGFGPDDTIKDVAYIMTEKMANPLQWGPISLVLPVPVAPDGGFGRRWNEAH